MGLVDLRFSLKDGCLNQIRSFSELILIYCHHNNGKNEATFPRQPTAKGGVGCHGSCFSTKGSSTHFSVFFLKFFIFDDAKEDREKVAVNVFYTWYGNFLSQQSKSG